MHRFLLHDGVIQPSAERSVSPGQTGFMNGWGVFSTLRVARGVLFAFERHWARMRTDAELMRVPFPADPEMFRRDLIRLVEANQAWESTLRVAVVRNRGGMFEGEGIERDSSTIAFTAPSNQWGEGVHLTVEPQARHSACRFTGAKITSWSHNLTWLDRAKEAGFDEVILLNERGEVAECTSANIFLEKDGVMATPPLSAGCLPGVTRELLLGDAKPAGCAVVERPLTLDEIFTADAVYVTSTTRDLLPVLSVQHRPLSRSGSLGDSFKKSFIAYVDAYVTSRV